MVPLDGERTILDVMMALQLPLILVAGSYLGTISHTLTALDCAVTGAACGCWRSSSARRQASTVPLDDTVAAIARFAEPVIGLPRQQPRRAAATGRQSEQDGGRLGRIFGQ